MKKHRFKTFPEAAKFAKKLALSNSRSARVLRADADFIVESDELPDSVLNNPVDDVQDGPAIPSKEVTNSSREESAKYSSVPASARKSKGNKNRSGGLSAAAAKRSASKTAMYFDARYSIRTEIGFIARCRKPNMSLLRSGGTLRVVGENSLSPISSAKPRYVHRIAEQRKLQHTAAEKEFEGILNSIWGGSLKNKFIREWAFKNWILDFYLYEVGVGIEVDGGYHSSEVQQKRDADKTYDCQAAGITLLRISNSEVFGDRKALVDKLHTSYEEGMLRSRNKRK